MTGLFALTLKKDGKSAFPPQSDEVTFEEKKAEGEAKPEDKKSGAEEERQREGQGEGQAREEGNAFPHRLQGPRLPRDAVPVDADNYQGVAGVRVTSSTSRPGRPSTAATAVEAGPRDLLDEGPQGVDPRRECRWLGGLPRRHQGPRPRRRHLHPTTQARHEGEEGRLHEGPGGGPRPRRGMGGSSSTRSGADTGTSSTCEHARLRLEGDRQRYGPSCPTWPTAPTSTTSSARWWRS